MSIDPDTARIAIVVLSLGFGRALLLGLAKLCRKQANRRARLSEHFGNGLRLPWPLSKKVTEELLSGAAVDDFVGQVGSEAHGESGRIVDGRTLSGAAIAKRSVHHILSWLR